MDINRHIHVMVLLVVAVTAIVLGGIWVSWRAADAKVIEAVEQGRTLLEQRRYRQAAAALKQAAQSWPDNMTIQLLLGQACWGEDRLINLSAQEALDAFRRAIELDPQQRYQASDLAQQQVIQMCLRHGYLGKAREMIDQMLQRPLPAAQRKAIDAMIIQIQLDQGVYQPTPDDKRNERGEVIEIAGTPPMRINRWVAKANHTPDPAEQIEWYQRAVKTDPQDYQSYFDLGLAHARLGQYPEAVDHFEKADQVYREVRQRDDEPFGRAQAWLATCWLEQDQTSVAMKHADIAARALRLGPTEGLFQLRLWTAVGQADKAVEPLEMMLAADPENVEIMHALAQAYLAAGKGDLANKMLVSALELVPPDHPLFVHRINTWRLMLSRGTEDLQMVQATRRAKQLLAARRYRECRDVLEQAIEKWPTDMYFHYLLGKANWGEDRRTRLSVDRAIEAFKRCVELDPQGRYPVSLRAQKQLALAYVRTERLDEARAVFSTIVEQNRDAEFVKHASAQIEEIDLDLGVYKPGEDDKLNEAGEVIVMAAGMQTNQWFEKGRHTTDPVKGEKWYRMATKTDPTMAPAFNNLGLSLYHLGRYEEAVPCFEKGAKLAEPLKDYRTPMSFIWLMRIWIRLGDLDRAAQALEKARQYGVTELEAAYAQLQLLVAQGHGDQAIEGLKMMLAQDPTSIELQYDLASAYAGAGQYDIAITTLTKALKEFDELQSPNIVFEVKRWREELEQWRRKVQ